MAVFTPLNADQVSSFLERYDVGTLDELAEVAGGTENSTFFVTTDQQRMVLTLFEQGGTDELPFFVDMLNFLAHHDLPVPGPIADRSGQALQTLADRPALLFPRLPGRSPEAPTPAQCTEIGRFMGRMHQISHTFDGQRSNQRDHRWVERQIPRVLPFLSTDEQALMTRYGHALCDRFSNAPALPQGAIHGDLFRDNSLFEGDRLGGVIDFYNGCVGDFIYDLAVLVNDWCHTQDGTLDEVRYNAMINAYVQERPVTDTERDYWHDMLKLTALRYWLSRLLVIHVDQPAFQLTPKPPRQFLDILNAHYATRLPDLP